MRFDEHGKTLYPEPAGCHDSTMEQVAVEFLDTHEAVRRLTDAGMPEPQAEVVVRVQADTHRHHLATREQVEKVWGEVEKVRAEVERVRAETEAAKVSTIRWVAGLNLALVGLVITFLQFS